MTESDKSNIIPFQRKKRRQKKADKAVMCRNGFHQWDVVTTQQFDVKQGKLVTKSRCRRCGKEKTEAR